MRQNIGWSSRIVLLIIVITTSTGLAQEDLSVIEDWRHHSDAPNALYHHLTGQAFDFLSQRKETIAQLRTAEQWRKRQQLVRQRLHGVMGQFPEKTPLNARVVSTVEKDHYQVENIIFESMPGFHVTGSLFLPEQLSAKVP
ncbi:MAG TPA: xylan esterase, partial [bacterium]|nr:xylan esterase [bacterium]